MHEVEITVEDPNPNSNSNWLLRLVFPLLLIAIAILHLVKDTASRYLEEVHSNFDPRRRTHSMPAPAPAPAPASASASASASDSNNHSVCAGCGNPGNKQCSRCKSVKYCSSNCQEVHWKSGHKLQCKKYDKVNLSRTPSPRVDFKVSGPASRRSSSIALVPASGRKLRDVLFPYAEFIELYNWNKPGFPPCGLLNCGNSCFANVVLQCLTYTRPLLAYLLEKGHRRECRRNEWCFLCVFQEHVERASQSSQAFSPMSILSRLPSLGGNLGYGKQEDAHEFMRVAIDMMQSVCLDEFGGEKAVCPSNQETTLIQHIFGGHLQSQVGCTKCDKVSNQLENMMDLTVEIHGEVRSLEECLDHFTAKEWLHGDNMYKCDGCNDYVKAWKQLTIKRAPNILTIALKRFRSGRFGKLNKRVTFPETLVLSPYMSEDADGSDLYTLYAVVVHVDMLNASFFGHYICYAKDFCGNWYKIDDCKVARVELEEVLSQEAYMLLYSRMSVRPSCLTSAQTSKKQQSVADFSSCMEEEKGDPSPSDLRAEHNSGSQEIGSNTHVDKCGFVTAASNSAAEDNSITDIHSLTGQVADNINASETCSSTGMEALDCQEDPVVALTSETLDRGLDVMNAVEPADSTIVSMEVSDSDQDLCAGITSKGDTMEDLNNEEAGNLELDPAVMTANCNVDSLSSGATITRTHKLKRNLPFHVMGAENRVKRAEVGNGY